MINAYLCEADPSLTNERPIDHARKIVQYLPIIQERISAVPMQLTIYLEFCGRALKEEAERLRSSGWHQRTSRHAAKFARRKAYDDCGSGANSRWSFRTDDDSHGKSRSSVQPTVRSTLFPVLRYSANMVQQRPHAESIIRNA
jgi:hypothetical protein